MVNDLTFKEVCKFIKKDDQSLVVAVDKLLGATIALSPAILGPQALPALSLIGAKNELTKLGQSLLEKVTSKKEADYLARMERMQTAYGLVCFTAFFQALDQLLPSALRKRIALQPHEKTYIADQAARQSACREDDQCAREALGQGVLDTPLLFPHPVVPFSEQTEQLGRLYKDMVNGFLGFLKKLAVWEQSDETTQVALQNIAEQLPKAALQHFEAQYVELARKYDDFCIWSRLHESKTALGQLKEQSDFLKRHASLLAESDKKIDIGFVKLQHTVLALPKHFRELQARDVVHGLKRHYEARINEPIIEDVYKPEDGRPALNFPKVSEAFVPQSYRMLRQTVKDRHLEKEETWNAIDAKHDLGPCLVSYLSSPYSTETPLLILGHPGSGKSLLTKVLCARLMSESYTPIRIPLWEVNADWPRRQD